MFVPQFSYKWRLAASSDPARVWLGKGHANRYISAAPTVLHSTAIDVYFAVAVI
jgi:hypothetical protein